MCVKAEKTYDTSCAIQYIADTLIVNGTIVDCPGLLYGKMGIAIFFMHYFRYTKIDAYRDYAIDLIKEIQNQIHADMSTDYGRGLSGIGAGIEYLAQNGFLNENTNDILSDIDNKIIMSIKSGHDNSYNMAEEITGAGLYLLWRISNPESYKKRNILESFLRQAIDLTSSEYSDFYTYNLLISETHRLNLYPQKTEVITKKLKEAANRKSDKYIISRFTDSQNKYIHHINKGGENGYAYSMFNTEHKMGLIGGMAGTGLYLLTCRNSNKAWYNLL